MSNVMCQIGRMAYGKERLDEVLIPAHTCKGKTNRRIDMAAQAIRERRQRITTTQIELDVIRLFSLMDDTATQGCPRLLVAHFCPSRRSSEAVQSRQPQCAPRAHG